jgi:outer membrane protein assembly factor BamB
MSYRYPLLAASFLIAASATAADWPRWRGPNNDDVSLEKGLMQKWPEGGPKLVWTGTNLGTGWGTPSIADGKVFGMGTRGGKDGVWALKEADGKEIWFTPFADPASGIGKQTNGPGSTPTYAKGKVYTVSHNGTVACMDATTGKTAWTKSYTADFGAGRLPSWGYNDSVLVDGDTVICAPGGPKAALVALKADTGAVIWTTDAGQVGGGAGYSSPVKATFGGTPMYVVLSGTSAGIVGVHAETGKLLWQYNGKGANGGTAQIPTPIVKGDLVWVSCSYQNGGSALLKVSGAGDKFDVKAIKTHEKPDLNNHHGGMVLVGDYIYFGHDQNQGSPVCVELKTGEIKWGPIKKSSDFANGGGSAAYTYADGRLYVRYQNGVMTLADPSPEGLKLVSSFKLPPASVASYSQSWPHPAVSNGKLYIRDQNAMYVYNVKA